MKKILCILLMLLMVTSCSKNTDNNINYSYDIESYPVDMSEYDGVNSTNHMFRRITVDQLFNCVDNKSSAVFYLGRTNCGCCQTTLKYLNEVALDLNVTVYYIDVYDKDMPLVGSEEDCPDCVVRTNRLKEILDSILYIDDEGKKQLQTPTIFSIINGELSDSIVCLADYAWDEPPTDKQIDRLRNKYSQILKPFSIQSQD